jgi:hypothetical protein
MPSPGRAPLFFTAAVVFAVLAVFALTKSVVDAFGENETLLTWQAPGTESFSVKEEGTVTIWHDYETYYEGRRVVADEDLPTGFSIQLSPEGSTQTIPFTPAGSTQTTQFGGTSKQAVGSFALPGAGTYLVTAKLSAGETRILSLTEGSLWAAFQKIGLGVALGILLGLAALVSLVVAIVTLTSRRKSSPLTTHAA